MSMKQKVLVVDDIPENIQILVEVLKSEYAVVTATTGRRALRIANAKEKPDIVLLDINMPNMDGFDVCLALKSNQDTEKIPVIFISTMDENIDEEKGFSCGAVDYIKKPIVPSIVKARVKSQLVLKSYRDDLAKQNEILRENASLKEDIDRITRHDLKAPLNGIINYPLMVLEEGNLSEKQEKRLKKVVDSGRNMLKMINNSLDLYKMEKGNYQVKNNRVDIISVIQAILAENHPTTTLNKYKIEFTMDDKPIKEKETFSLMGEELLYYSLLANLVKNAFEASPKGGEIKVSLFHSKEKTLAIHNEMMIPHDIQSSFFQKYATHGKANGTGLGTYSAKLIAETLGGKIWFTTSEQEGTSINLQFPL